MPLKKEESGIEKEEDFERFKENISEDRNWQEARSPRKETLSLELTVPSRWVKRFESLNLLFGQITYFVGINCLY